MPRTKNTTPPVGEEPFPPEIRRSNRGRKKGTKNKAKANLDVHKVGDAEFLVSDRGGMEIRDGQQTIKLERRDVQRLEKLLTTAKGLGE